MKKALLLSLIALLGASVATARNFKFTYEGKTLSYTVISEDNKTCSSYYIGNNLSGTLIIPEKVSDGTDEYTVISIEDSGIRNCELLTSITLPETVTSIGDYAFIGNRGLIEVTFGNSVTTIGDHAFDDCYSLTNVTLPNSVTEIGEYAFYNCYELKSINIPNSVTTIRQRTFYGCNLTEITIPSSVTSIGIEAFHGCNLTEITIPNSVTKIGNAVFSGCSKLTSIEVESGNKDYSSSNGVLFNKDQTELIQYPAGKEGDYEIPESVTRIYAAAFSRCNGLTSVTIPNSITYISTEAFYYCGNLKSVNIANSVTSIGYCSFYGCSGLTSVNIPNSVTSIGGYSFKLCRSLTSVTIPNSVTSIDTEAFYYCDKLTEVKYLSDNPCTANENIFSSEIYDNATLIIPEGMTDVYMGTSPWNLFKNIVEEVWLSAIDTVEADNATIGAIDYSAPYDVYNLQGIRVAGSTIGLTPGIYIIRQGIKTAKIVIK
ncbi:MAG: leucine-rich repeat domain-containing protein [Bacteroides sp.]|nr:leucine-rich repeat domain-containing protein [Bacteroides sp.]